jgi:four helix bundle protein
MAEETFNFEKLLVYQKAIKFAGFVYKITAGYPRDEKFVLCDQFRRAAISISLNIAEGYGGSGLQFKRYLNIVKGSIRECVALTTLSKQNKYITYEQELTLRAYCIELSKMLAGLLKLL